MPKKRPVKLKEQAERITLRQGTADIVASPDGPEIEAPASEHVKNSQQHADRTIPDEQGNNSKTKQQDPDLTGDLLNSTKTQADAPIAGKFASKLSDEDLTTIATHPESVEADWLPAFTELDKRAKAPALAPRKNTRKKFALLVAAVVGFSIGSATVRHFSHATSAPAKATGAFDPRAPYVLSSAQHQSAQLKNRAIIRLAQAIDTRGWTSSKAAAYFAVSEAEIDAIMRGDHCSLSMDELNKMLFALGASTQFPNRASGEELQQTVAYYTRVIAVNPQRTGSFDHRATAYLALKQYDLAIADLKRYVELKPGIAGPRNNLVGAYLQAGKFQEALQTENELHALFPNYDIYQQRALIYMALGQNDKSISDSTRAITQMDLPRPGPYWNRALVYEILGQNKEAIADCKKVLEIDPTYDSAAKMITRLQNKL